MSAAIFLDRIRGSSLLDELTAVVVLSVGLLGLAGLQGRVQNLASNAESTTLALTLAQNELERLRGVAADPGRAEEGYGHIAGNNRIIEAIDGQHLETAFTLHVDAVRFRLQGDAETPGAHYVAADDAAPVQAGVHEFKRVGVTVTWMRNGNAHSVAVPGIISPAAF